MLNPQTKVKITKVYKQCILQCFQKQSSHEITFTNILLFIKVRHIVLGTFGKKCKRNTTSNQLNIY